MDNIPLVPAALGSRNLLRCRGAEYETLDLCFGLGLSAEAHEEAYEQAEYQHSSAEVQPVEVVEYGLEPALGSTLYAGVENLGTQTDDTDNET